jgi:DNA-binding HxlR family transcriptional regulator
LSEPTWQPMQNEPSDPRSGSASATGGGTDIVWDAVRGVWRFAALHAMIKLGCVEQLVAGPLTVTELARRCGANAPALARVLRTVASMGLVTAVESGAYALTDAGAALAAPDSAMRLCVPFTAEEACWYALGALPQTVRTGRSAFLERYGSLYEYLAGNPDSARLFDDFMTARALPVAAAVAAQHDFSDVETVMDIGGGKGHFLAAILRAHPHLRGMLLELDHVLPGAQDFLAAEGVADRCELIPGDYFKHVPGGADVYLMASVLHTWDDKDALRLLRSIRPSVPDHGRLLLVDAIIPDDERLHYGKDLDIRILSLFGDGKERTRTEYFELLGKAQLHADRAVELAMGMSLIEAAPR